MKKRDKRMTGRRFKAALALILALVLLACACGCGNGPSNNGNVSPSNSGRPSGGGNNAPEAPPAVTALGCLKDAGLIQSIVPAGDGRALVSCWTGEFGNMGSVISLVDLEKDAVLAQSAPEDDLGEPEGIRPNGEIVTSDIAGGSIYFLDSNFKLIRTLPAVGRSVSYSSQDDLLYITDGRRVFTLSPDGAEETVIEFRNWTEVSAADPYSRTVLVMGKSTNSSAADYYGVFSFSGEKLVYWEYDSDVMAVGTLAGSGMIAQCYEAFGEDSFERYALVACGITSPSGAEKTAAVYECPGQTEICCFGGCRYAVASKTVYPANGSDHSELYIYDLAEGQSFRLDDLTPSRFVTAAWDPAGERILIGASDDDSGELFIVSPRYLKESEPLKTVSLPEWPGDKEITELPEHLAEARAIADEIEAAYGVKVLISSQADVLHVDRYLFGSTSLLDPKEEASALKERLTVLKEALSVYPEGFFDMFRNSAGEGGLRFEIFDGMRKTDGSFAAGGLQTLTGAWYDVALDLYYSSGPSVHHELWHAVEKCAEGDGVQMDSADWTALNPSGFSYIYNHGSFIDAFDKNTILGFTNKKANAYFAYPYSIVDGKEDRATIIELLFQNTDRLKKQYDYIGEYPHVKAKLDRMAELIRPVFGYVYWEEMMK